MTATVSNRASVIAAHQREEWRSALPSNRSVFGSVEFLSIVARRNGGDPKLFVYDTTRGRIAYPYLQRPLSALPFAVGDHLKAYDIVSPEYTGPLPDGDVDLGTMQAFRSGFAAHCRARRIVSEFAHLHPWVDNLPLLRNDGVNSDREIVYVDLSWDEDRLWNESLRYACRKNIRRAERENVRTHVAVSTEDIRAFHRVYTRTMRRNGALESYYFPYEYFAAIFSDMSANARFVLAEKDDKIIAGTLYLHDEENVYSYLGGADERYQNARPTNAIVYKTMLWAKAAGKSRLILGGGVPPRRRHLAVQADVFAADDCV